MFTCTPLLKANPDCDGNRRTRNRCLYALISLVLGLGATLPASVLVAPRAVTEVYEPGATGIRDDVRSVVQITDGTVVVGSNSLAAFDGSQWQTIPVSHTYAFRALAPGNAHAPHRVWIGAVDEIGYVERDARGDWQHTSLTADAASAGLPSLGDVWSVRPLADGAVWVTNDHVLRWNPHASHEDRLKIWHLPARSRLAAFGGGTTVWVYQEGVGLLRLEIAGDPRLVLPEAALPEKPVTWMLPTDEARTTTLLGLNDGAYRWSEGESPQRLDRLSAALKGKLPMDAVALSGGRVAVATFKDGVVVASDDGQRIDRYSLSEGLPDNSVYALWARGHALWAASPSGLTRIDGVGVSQFFDRRESIGGAHPLTFVQHDAAGYLLTTRNLFRLSQRSADAGTGLDGEPVAEGVFSDAAAIAGDLWFSGFGGLWRVPNGQAIQEHFVASDVPQLAASSRFPDGVLFLEGYHLKMLMPASRGGWIARDLGVRVDDTPVSLVENTDGDVWVSTMKDGVTRYTWDQRAPADAPRLRLNKTYRNGLGLPANAGPVKLVSFGTRLYAFTDHDILALKANKLLFEPAPEFIAFKGIAATRPSSENANLAHWIVQAKSLANRGVVGALRLSMDASGSITVTEMATPGIDGVGAVTMAADTGDSLWLGGGRGLLRILKSGLQSASAPLPAPLVVSQDPHQKNFIDFRFAVPSAAGETLFYQSRLSGVETDWSLPSAESHRSFGGLGSAAYRFDVRVLDRFGRVGPIVSHAFVVHAPWWKTTPAFAGYGIVAVLFVAGIARLRLVRLRRKNERLNQLVQERTREIELVSTAKSEFLDNISHEIRNPLNGLTGLLALLKEERLDAREQQLARSLKSVATTLTQVFEEVLQFSKLEYGYGQLERRPFALKPLLEEIVALFASQAEQAGCALSLSWPPALHDGFQGDPEKIKTIIINFVGNALKYAPRAPVEINVEVTGETDGMVDLYLDVIDHGPGVPAEEQELIFKKFVRGKRAGASNVPGTGLGLATCRMLAKLMNGSVGVESTAGPGATFHLKLLLPRTDLSPATAAPNLTAAADVSKHRMLIVDDEAYNRVVLEGIALEIGASCDTASSAAAALQHLSTGNYTVVFLDWELPDANGGDIARTLHTAANGPRPIILATTAHDSDEMRRRCRDAGMDGFLLKPYDAPKVRRAIEEVHKARVTGTNSLGQDGNLRNSDLDLGAFDYYNRARPGSPDSARQLYIQAIEEQAATLTAAVAAGRTDAISMGAHRLRALSGMVRATDLNRAATRLEELARHGSAEACTAAWESTKTACDNLRQRLA